MIECDVRRGSYRISTDKALLNIPAIHHWLSTASYWAQGRPMETTVRAIEHSLCFGVYHESKQVGFARVVSDYATFAWLADVFVLDEYQGQGLGRWLVETIVGQPALRDLRRIALATRDAHGLYERYGGFEPLAKPQNWLVREKSV